MSRHVKARGTGARLTAMIARLERKATIARALDAGQTIEAAAEAVGVCVRTARDDAKDIRAAHLRFVPGGPAAWFDAQANELRAMAAD